MQNLINIPIGVPMHIFTIIRQNLLIPMVWKERTLESDFIRPSEHQRWLQSQKLVVKINLKHYIFWLSQELKMDSMMFPPGNNPMNILRSSRCRYDSIKYSRRC